MAGISGINQNYFFGGQTSSSIGTLFGSLGTASGVNSLSSVLSDYKTIQTGNYGKLLKAYYGQNNNPAPTKSTTRNTAAEKANSALKSSLSDTKSKMDKLSDSANALAATGDDSLFVKKEIKQADGTSKTDYDVDKIYSAVQGFVGRYNDAVSAASSSTNRSVANGASSLSSTTDVMAKRLQSFGITSDVNGKLSVDEDTFKKSDMDKFKTLVNGNQSYAANIAQTASRISGTSSNKLSSLSASSSTYGKSGGYSSADYSSLFNSYF